MMSRSLSMMVMAVTLAGTAVVAAHGCSKGTRPANELRVGVTSGPHAEIMEFVATEARKRGLRLDVVEFSDYVQPNAALADGSLDVNSYQHVPYLEQQRRDRGYRFVSVGTTVVFPMAAYSVRHRRLEDLPRGATLAIPNDPTNGGRALRLLESAGLLRLREAAQVSPLDVAWTRGGYRIKELDAAQLTRALDDVDLAVINTNYAIEAGLDPFKGLVREPEKSPYANVLVVREGDENRAEVKLLVEVYQSPPVRRFVDGRFKGAVVAAW